MKNNSNKNTTQRVVNSIQTIVNNGEYEKFLKFQKNFTKYSFCNKVLIYNQFPEATKVAGKKAWRDMGRELIPNPQEIRIIAGMPKKARKKVKKIVDNKEIEETEIYDYISYKSVYVYDISQTTGKAILKENEAINNNTMAYFYGKLKNFSQFPIYEKELNGIKKGFYDSSKKQIVLEKSMSIADKVAVLLHELIYVLYDNFDYKNNKNLSRIFVESIAYIVIDHFGLNTSVCNFDNISKWVIDDSEIIINLGNEIQRCANEFIKNIEKTEIQALELVA